MWREPPSNENSLADFRKQALSSFDVVVKNAMETFNDGLVEELSSLSAEFARCLNDVDGDDPTFSSSYAETNANNAGRSVDRSQCSVRNSNSFDGADSGTLMSIPRGMSSTKQRNFRVECVIASDQRNIAPGKVRLLSTHVWLGNLQACCLNARDIINHLTQFGLNNNCYVDASRKSMAFLRYEFRADACNAYNFLKHRRFSGNTLQVGWAGGGVIIQKDCIDRRTGEAIVSDLFIENVRSLIPHENESSGRIQVEW